MAQQRETCLIMFSLILLSGSVANDCLIWSQKQKHMNAQKKMAST